MYKFSSVTILHKSTTLTGATQAWKHTHKDSYVYMYRYLYMYINMNWYLYTICIHICKDIYLYTYIQRQHNTLAIYIARQLWGHFKRIVCTTLIYLLQIKYKHVVNKWEQTIGHICKLEVLLLGRYRYKAYLRMLLDMSRRKRQLITISNKLDKA